MEKSFKLWCVSFCTDSFENGFWRAAVGCQYISGFLMVKNYKTGLPVFVLHSFQFNLKNGMVVCLNNTFFITVEPAKGFLGMFPKVPFAVEKLRPGNKWARPQVIPSHQKLHESTCILFACIASVHLRTALLCTIPFYKQGWITRRVLSLPQNI